MQMNPSIANKLAERPKPSKELKVNATNNKLVVLPHVYTTNDSSLKVNERNCRRRWYALPSKEIKVKNDKK
jgi:hypothetical protein